MAKWQGISWGKEHTSKSTPQPHRDVYSRSSDSGKTTKVGHANSGSGKSGKGSGSKGK